MNEQEKADPNLVDTQGARAHCPMCGHRVVEPHELYRCGRKSCSAIWCRFCGESHLCRSCGFREMPGLQPDTWEVPEFPPEALKPPEKIG